MKQRKWHRAAQHGRIMLSKTIAQLIICFLFSGLVFSQVAAIRPEIDVDKFAFTDQIKGIF